ncbi:MAG: class I SAM-dependent DNA methyltransferase, partial [Pseudomonadota bacterium]
AYFHGVLSSTVHGKWSLASGSTLEDRPVYVKTRCFENFPFPLANEEQKQKIRTLAEQLDAHRKNQQAKHPELTLTGMYNVLEKLKSGEALNAKDKIIHEQGLVSVLRQLHHELDLAVLDAYGWNELTALMNVVNGTATAKDKTRDELARELEEALLEKLVALNGQRFDEEKSGIIHWLRPEYQHPTGTTTQSNATQGEMDVALAAVTELDGEAEALVSASIVKQAWPKDDIAQVKAIIDLFNSTKHPMALDTIATYFSGKGPWKKRLPNILEMLVVVGKARADGDKFAGC